VFTGGKIEFRKGQDLVIRAFREFAARHDDAVLVAAWHSPWAGSGAGYGHNLEHALGQDEKGTLQIRRWAIENGIKPHQFIELPLTANSLMAAVLREMDCAIQVSRCEACTNLPAKEAMACGVPVIVPNNTGNREEIVEALETLYTDTARRKRIGARGAQWILEKQRTWRDHARLLKDHLLSLV
jgi:glycosyltransferase involved in cell wall biosynthesis